VTPERINQLFQTGAISSEEHSFLMKKLFFQETRISGFAWASLLCAALAWLLMLSFTKGRQSFALLPGEGRLIAGLILAPLSLIFYYLARKEIRESAGEVGGLAIAARGQAVAIAILLIIVPALFLMMW